MMIRMHDGGTCDDFSRLSRFPQLLSSDGVYVAFAILTYRLHTLMNVFHTYAGKAIVYIRSRLTWLLHG